MPAHTIDMTLFLAEAIDPERLVAEIAPAVPGALTFKNGHQGPYSWAAWTQITIADEATFAAFDVRGVWKAVQERFLGTAVDFSCSEWRVGFRIDRDGASELEHHDRQEAKPRSLDALEEILPPEADVLPPRASSDGHNPGA